MSIDVSKKVYVMLRKLWICRFMLGKLYKYFTEVSKFVLEILENSKAIASVLP